MKDLVSSRGWEYAYVKTLEDRIETCRDALENNDRADDFQYIRGQICGIRDAIRDLMETRKRFDADDDKDGDLDNS